MPMRVRISSARRFRHLALNFFNSVEAFTEDGFEGGAERERFSLNSVSLQI